MDNRFSLRDMGPTDDDKARIAEALGTTLKDLQARWEAASLSGRELVHPFQWGDIDRRLAERLVAGELIDATPDDWPGMTQHQRNCAREVYERLAQEPMFWDELESDWDADEVQGPAVRYLLWGRWLVARTVRKGGRSRVLLHAIEL